MLLHRCAQEGKLVIRDVVATELFVCFNSAERFASWFEAFNMLFDPMTFESATLAGEICREDRLQGGKQERVIPDFLIGGHAITQADRLVTSDTGDAKRYFRDSKLLSP